MSGKQSAPKMAVYTLCLLIIGAVCGAICDQIVKQPQLFDSNFYSAIVGAFVGGLISFLLQMQAIQKSEKEKVAENNLREEFLGRSTIVKTLRILNNLTLYKKHIEESYKVAPKEMHADPFTFVKALSGNFDIINFSNEELSYVMMFKDANLFSDIMILDEKHNSVTENLKLYRDIRQNFMDTTPANMNGDVGSVELTADELRIYRPKMVSMNILVEELRTSTTEDAEFARSALTRLEAALKPSGVFPFKLEIPNGDPEKAA